MTQPTFLCAKLLYSHHTINWSWKFDFTVQHVVLFMRNLGHRQVSRMTEDTVNKQIKDSRTQHRWVVWAVSPHLEPILFLLSSSELCWSQHALCQGCGRIQIKSYCFKIDTVMSKLLPSPNGWTFPSLCNMFTTDHAQSLETAIRKILGH